MNAENSAFTTYFCAIKVNEHTKISILFENTDNMQIIIAFYLLLLSSIVTRSTFPPNGGFSFESFTSRLCI